MHRACVHHASAFPVLCPSLGDDHHASFRSYPIIRPLIASFQGSNRAGCTRSDCVCLGTVPVSGRDGVASACAKMLAQYGPSSSTSAKKLAQHTQKRRNWDVVSALGELFRAHAHIKPRRANFSRTGRSDMAALKPMTPLQPLMQANVKPPSPLRTPQQRPLKPTTPLQPKNAQKTPISHPQRRRRFQLAHLTSPQRR